MVSSAGEAKATGEGKVPGKEQKRAAKSGCPFRILRMSHLFQRSLKSYFSPILIISPSDMKPNLSSQSENSLIPVWKI